ncbi:MAG TPA: protein-glutamate O-methyltransferase CheR [Firmicutes bacterium]|nr:protein-glutamate O-methyltransferase CheR [Bacillota bacterium]
MEPVAADYEAFKRRLKGTIGLDLNYYKHQQMHRRIHQWLQRVGAASYDEYIKRLQADPEERQRFAEYLTINTSQFYRDVSVFKEIEEKVLPELVQRYRRLRVWCAGCSTGPEIYTVAMILEELTPGVRHSLLGTDFDTGALTQAEEGLYSDNLLNSLPAKYREKYFTQEGRMWRLTETIRDRVRFRRHNLLEDPFDTGFHLILCRNVFIYFTPEAQARLTKQFSDSLVSGGYFVVGNAENLLEPEMADLKRVSYCIYQRA